ncbi:SCRN [Mytilus edulis]|uniref:SCRN n=1 Tax=Mytilus edulis TaxID=6550 RepID=A0A8S3Q8Z4_MYTED|nr:SCRN [Mytilus edulis]
MIYYFLFLKIFDYTQIVSQNKREIMMEMYSYTGKLEIVLLDGLQYQACMLGFDVATIFYRIAEHITRINSSDDCLCIVIFNEILVIEFKLKMAKPQSCDTFVALPPSTADGCIIFGKNSDRPDEEVQEVEYYPSKEHQPGSKVMCTYIEIDQVPKTNDVILSKPAWMWGAEMGANQHGVCIGNEAVWTKLNSDDDLTERLLGMDIVRKWLCQFGCIFGMRDMAKILRDEKNEICRLGGGGLSLSTGSQISVIPTGASPSPPLHWFTATPNPNVSIYKPFIFCPDVDLGDLTVSPKFGADDPLIMQPRFSKTVDRRHALYKGHENFVKLLNTENSMGLMISQNLKELEDKCVEDMMEILQNFDENSCKKVSQIFKHMCNIELNFYKIG